MATTLYLPYQWKQKVVIGNEVKEISLNNDMSSSEKAVFAADTRAGATNQILFQRNSR